MGIDLKTKFAKPNQKQYNLSDGDGLFLLIHPNGSKHWRFRYFLFGKEKVLSIGQYPMFPLGEARNLKDEVKLLLAKNIDPIIEKKTKQLEDEIQVTFEQVG